MRLTQRVDPSGVPAATNRPGDHPISERLHMTLTDSRTPASGPAPAPTRTGVAAEMAAVVTPLFGGELPVRIRAWDGSVAGPENAPTVVVNDPAALRRLVFRPGELGLAQAYVTKEIDVEGDLLDGFRRVWQSVRERGASPRLTASTVYVGSSGSCVK